MEPSSRLEPFGFFAGMVFAMVTRDSCGARLKWFQYLDWWKVPRMHRGRTPSSKEAKAPFKGRICFDDLVDKDVAQQCGYRMPVSLRHERGTRSGVWSSAADPDATVTAPGVAL